MNKWQKIGLWVLVAILAAILLVWMGRAFINNIRKNDKPIFQADSAKIYKAAADSARTDYLRADSAFRSPVTERERADYRRAVRQRDSLRAIKGYAH